MSGDPRITLRYSHGTVVNDKACRSASLYVPDRPILFFVLTLLESTLTDLGHSNTIGKPLGQTRSLLCKKKLVMMGRGWRPLKILLRFFFALILVDRIWSLKNGWKASWTNLVQALYKIVGTLAWRVVSPQNCIF